jgi:hypothetical protein
MVFQYGLGEDSDEESRWVSEEVVMFFLDLGSGSTGMFPTHSLSC